MSRGLGDVYKRQFDVFLPLEENAFLAVGHYGKATEPDEPVVFRITTDF